MGLLFKARGTPSFILFLVRFSLGSMFLISGANKAVDVEGFINHVKSLNVLPENLAFIFGFILPFAEVLFGALYLIGLFTPLTSFFLSFITLGIITSLGPGDPVLPFSYNFVFLACTIGTIFSGAGVISFDALLDRKKHDEPYTVTRHVTVTDNNNVTLVKKEPYKEVKEVREIKVEPGDIKTGGDTNEELNP